jgi:hypothetical protein
VKPALISRLTKRFSMGVGMSMGCIGHDFEEGSAFFYNLCIAELSELLAGRFTNPAKAFARLRVNRVGNAE